MKHASKKWLLITGVSTAGKSFIGDCLPESMFFTPVSDTTRPPRSHEMNGIDYYFVNNDFKEKALKGLYIETTEFVGNSYGVTYEEISKANGRIIAHVCDWSGLSVLSNRYDSLRVFIDIAPRDIISRMLARWMDNEKEDLEYLAKRIHHALTVEMEWSGMVDIYYSDSDEFKKDMPSLVRNLINQEYKPKPFKIKRSSKYKLLHVEPILQFLTNSSRPRRGEIHKTMSSELLAIINQY